MEGTPYIDVKDRISRLPDNLIHHIMSFMDTKYAVQTSVLSKRWIHVWKSPPFLNFDRWSFSVNKKDSFVMFLFSYDKAKYVDIILPRSMSLPRLKMLFLYGLSISNVESSKRLFSSCTVLEDLLIADCDIQTNNQRKLIVDSVTLKEISYTCWRRDLLPQNDTIATSVKLCASNLETFTCRCFLAQDYSLEICSPLSRVYFDVTLNVNEKDETAEAYSSLTSEEKEVYGKRVMQFLGAVYMVKTMKLSPGFLEVRVLPLFHITYLHIWFKELPSQICEKAKGASA
ncbi:F-box/LRR-repeat protein At1g55660-like [Papaver somniferum]|uniref:F-box/LRR-repeat protein At1g55660-like n=1 Tax=Papaver somniferum TaxID=3469 RepID=UPI000E6FCFCD|nr:F-box/LRR-repeat protein At1g55660-like [Papaver somniferum]